MQLSTSQADKNCRRISDTTEVGAEQRPMIREVSSISFVTQMPPIPTYLIQCNKEVVEGQKSGHYRGHESIPESSLQRVLKRMMVSTQAPKGAHRPMEAELRSKNLTQTPCISGVYLESFIKIPPTNPGGHSHF